MARKEQDKPGYLLDALSKQDLKKWREQYQQFSEYCWNNYSYYAHKRSLIKDELKNSLLEHCVSYRFSNYRRVIDNKFNDNPLSAKGSILNEVGGRFNIGDIDQEKFPKFAGLYIAEDTETALKEKYGIDSDEIISGLTAQQLNLAGNFSVFNIKGELTSILNLCDEASLHDFFNLIHSIKTPLEFVLTAKKLGITPMYTVGSLVVLRGTLLCDSWREMPMLFDIPANSQILGQLVHAAGIEGILYPSVKTQKKCLVVFPSNFEHSTAWIEIEGDFSSAIKNYRIDCNTFNFFY